MEALGYHVTFFGQKGHYGVATLSKAAPTAVQHGFPSDGEDAQRRFYRPKRALRLWKPVGPERLFPQGESRDHPSKFPAKTAFYADLQTYLEKALTPSDSVMVGGYEHCPRDEDIGIGPENAKRWLRTGKTSFFRKSEIGLSGCWAGA